MVEEGLSAVGAGGTAKRPCPYCGSWNLQDYRFCQKCGKELPAIPPSSETPKPPSDSPAPPTPLPAPSQPAGPLTRAQLVEFGSGYADESASRERPLTDDEKARLKRAARRPAAQATRPLGLIFGIAPPLFIAMSMGGAAFVPEAAAVVLVISGVVGFAMGAVSMNGRAGPLMATARGSVTEVAGLATAQPGPRPRTTRLDIGGQVVVVKGSAASALKPETLTRLAFVDFGIKSAAKGPSAGFSSGLLLDVNGAALNPPSAIMIQAPASSGAPQSPPERFWK